MKTKSQDIPPLNETLKELVNYFSETYPENFIKYLQFALKRYPKIYKKFDEK